MQRRRFVKGTLGGAFALTSGLTLPGISFADDARQALVTSNLVYLSPIRANGALSRCQAEVWYVMLGADIYVVTRADSWRARAVNMGVNTTRIWVGDLGVWKRADYQSLPALTALGNQTTDTGVTAAALERFGTKYADEWGTWGPRFKKGLADGSRVLLKYRLA